MHISLMFINSNENLFITNQNIFSRNSFSSHMTMNKPNRQGQQLRQISIKLKGLTQITFNLKYAAYKMTNLPIETVKHKINTSNNSILTTIDSIFYDLKKIETILLKHFQSPNFSHLKYSHQQKPYYQKHTETLPKNYLSRSEFDTFGEQSHNSFNRVHQISKNNFKKSDPKSYLLEESFTPKELSRYTSANDQINHINRTLLINPQRNRKRSHDIGISKVSSQQNVRLSQHPTIKAQRSTHLNQSSPYNSQLNQHNSFLYLNKFYFEQCQKEEDNERFLNQISKSRQKVLKSIEKKKKKCFDAIKNISSNMFQGTIPYKEQKITKKPKMKSQTQKFSPYETHYNDKDPAYYMHLVSSEQFIGI